ncbi:MAG: isoleucine--tRNA ligase [Candidatus Levybacteria bacterium]|nr:isoleucine--tRNA ligase [Candidatus Levybacteria bacterium]
MFKPVSPKVEFPKLEEEILTYWKKNKIFEKSVTSRPENKKWTFLDGPPFITGMPHYGTLLASLPKDLFPRFKTMQGYRVRRVWGWDCHGLPAENKVETKLGLKSKREIEEKVGVKKFIEECKLYVSEVSSEWEWYIDHIGRWVDFRDAYKTMDRSYMETVMWVFKQMYDKGYIYKGLRVSLYCPHCATPISNFEVAMDADNYKEVQDAATIYKYPLKDEKDTFILAWSTTPWNKIVTPALAVNPKLTYVKVKKDAEFYILAKSTLKILNKESHPEPMPHVVPQDFQLDSGSDEMPKRVRHDKKTWDEYEIVDEFLGEKLIGKEFVPHYDYYRSKIGKDKKAFIVIGGDFVTAEEGTGVVTIAAYGEEDLKAMQEQGIHIEMHLDDEGTIKEDVPLFGGMYYLKANKFVNDDLAKRGRIYKDEMLPHNVPLCWRCHTRLYYGPQDAWYVNIQKLKPLLKETNEAVNWFPKHFKYGRFLKSLENAPDWNISRSRYWGSPVPVWECRRCGERFVPGSIAELEEASGQKITDLHKPDIDEVIVTCKKCGKKAHRVPEVLDSWIEAGSASFAERHFPFSNAKLEEFFPPDFIVEYTGQIRAWFYVVHVIAGALYKSQGFKNVAVTGVILGTDGRKMSKNYGNYPDPKELLQKYGGDALRLYLMGSPIMHGEDILISEEHYRNQVRGMMLILWNVYNFFLTYVNVDSWSPQTRNAKQKSKNILDQWILSLLHKLIKGVTDDLENFDTVNAIAKVQKFVDEFSTWYIRRSRDRVGQTADDKEDKQSFYETSYEVLVTMTKLLAPIIPFFAEAVYRNLTDEESVHLTDWPTFDKSLIDDELEKEMYAAREIVELVHAKRKELQIKVKQPLQSLSIISPVAISGDIKRLIAEEVNIKDVTVSSGEQLSLKELDTTITQGLKEEGLAREIIRSIQEERKKMGTSVSEQIDAQLSSWPEAFTEYIKKQALIRTLSKGDTLQVTKV